MLVVQQVRTLDLMAEQAQSLEQVSQQCLQQVAVELVSLDVTVGPAVVQVADPQLVHQTQLELELQDKVPTVALVEMETVLALLRSGVAAVAAVPVQ